ncbi:hypothetical protein NPIL_449921 [Nephila pilipes]|uniref:Uncharacterized protein n=1 Tax=Nephila pilipes TaxID=299642 RepID=A0A8X6NTI3_NEPPI|nr:hypothetical protein NPIL_449921 [Nephila pilipes]
MNQVKILNKNVIEIREVFPISAEKSDNLLKKKSVLEISSMIEKNKTFLRKKPIMISDKNLTNAFAGPITGTKRSNISLSDDSSSSGKKFKEYLKKEDADDECQAIKVVPNSFKSYSRANLYHSQEKIPPVATKVIYVGETSQIPIIKQAMSASKCAETSAANLLLNNVPSLNKELTLQIKHMSVEKVSNGKQSAETNSPEVASSQKVIINLPNEKPVLESERKPDIINFSGNGSTFQNEQLKNIVENKQITVLPIGSIANVTSPSLQLPSQNSKTELCVLQNFNDAKNVSIKSYSPIKFDSQKQVRTSYEIVNTQPFKFITNKSSIAKPSSSEDLKSFTSCTVSSGEKDIIHCRDSAEDMEHKCPLTNVSPAHTTPKAYIISPLEKNQVTCTKRNVIKNKSKKSSSPITSPRTKISFVNRKKISPKSKNNSCETQNKSSASKVNSSAKKITNMPAKVSSVKQDKVTCNKNYSCKTINKNSAVEVAFCVPKIASASSIIALPKSDEIRNEKNNMQEIGSKNIQQLTQHKNRFVSVNKVTDSAVISKIKPKILFLRTVLQKLPDVIYQECIKKGYINVQKLAEMYISTTYRQRRYPVSTSSNVQATSLKLGQQNDCNKKIPNTLDILKKNVSKHVASLSAEKDVLPLSRNVKWSIQSVFPVLRKDALPCNLQLFKVNVDDMKKINICLEDSTIKPKNTFVTVSPAASKQQIFPVKILINENAEKGESNQVIKGPISTSSVMHLNTPVQQTLTKNNSKNIEELLELSAKKKIENEKMKKKEKIIQKMLLKYEEKEEKKQFKYLQKKLIHFIEKYKSHFKGRFGLLMDTFTNSSKLMEEIHNLNRAESDDARHLLLKLVKKILGNSDSVVIRENRKKDAESQSAQEKQIANKRSVESFVNISTSKIKKRLHTPSLECKGGKSLPRCTSGNIFSSSPSQDNVYLYDPNSENVRKAREEVISYSKKANESPKKDPYKLLSQNMKPHTDDPYADFSLITVSVILSTICERFSTDSCKYVVINRGIS